MLVSCPQCKANYQLEDNIHDVLLVCHRCATEFQLNSVENKPSIKDQEASLFPSTPQAIDSITNTPIVPAGDPDSPAIAQQDHPEHSHAKETSATIALSHEHLLPKRPTARAWPWLAMILLCLAALGFWQQQKQWLTQPWLRSLMMNMQISINPSPADWLISKKDIHSQWIERQDGSNVLFIDGYIQNRLLSDQLPPAIQIRFFDMPHGHPIQTQRLAITEPPSLPAIRHTPYNPPAIDRVPINAKGKRAFTLLIEHIPSQTREFSVMVATP